MLISPVAVIKFRSRSGKVARLSRRSNSPALPSELPKGVCVKFWLVSCLQFDASSRRDKNVIDLARVTDRIMVRERIPSRATISNCCPSNWRSAYRSGEAFTIRHNWRSPGLPNKTLDRRCVRYGQVQLANRPLQPTRRHFSPEMLESMIDLSTWRRLLSAASRTKPLQIPCPPVATPWVPGHARTCSTRNVTILERESWVVQRYQIYWGQRYESLPVTVTRGVESSRET